ncbi:HNH endonuclease [Vibrio metoecus]|uniref:HNH endonuclease n=1 Tax=Vibrio metoecus TaxID=1481663 RepID=UPI000BA9B3D3|nr:HNH endonuclease signature motif containing protein [Vibrio metoecus]PAR35832.1 hypothetical protein CGT97_09715 [Vibrio metoecus]PAR44096.1 hypothetical protein CGT96_04045 [Vibrio metoecus]
MSKQRKLVWEKSGGKCWYCGCDLPKNGWHADHYYPIVRLLEENRNEKGRLLGYKTGKDCLYPELDKIENLVPACAPCNNFKHSLSPEQYRIAIANQFENVLKNSTGLRQLQRLNLVDLDKKPVVFWFEKEGLSMPSLWELMGISEEALAVKWVKDNQEPDYYHQWIGERMITLRRLGHYWLIIAIDKDWNSSNRIEIPNSPVEKAQAQAAEWAIRLNAKLDSERAAA